MMTIAIENIDQATPGRLTYTNLTPVSTVKVTVQLILS